MITNIQLYIAIGLPVFAIITSLVISMVQISGIREDLRFQVGSIREDIREIRSDMKLLTGKVYELMGQSLNRRVARYGGLMRRVRSQSRQRD